MGWVHVLPTADTTPATCVLLNMSQTLPSTSRAALLSLYLSIKVLQVWQQLQHLLPVVRQPCQGVAFKACDLQDKQHTSEWWSKLLVCAGCTYV